MMIINARNVNDALPSALGRLSLLGVREDSRNGPILVMPEPVTTVLHKPCERVLFAPWRDANPFFHLVEALWMLAGRDDLRSLTPYVKQMSEYTDDGVTVPGAYGKRWRSWFAPEDNAGQLDQLDWAVKRLRANPADRRVVIQMWDARVDPYRADWNSKDVPCNLTILPWVRAGALHITIFNRSNDIIWGLYGANAVHFSFLLEYLAARLGLAVGTMTTVSNNFHAYEDKMPNGPVQHIHDHYVAGLFPEWALSYSIFNGWADIPDVPRERMIAEDLAIFFGHGAREAATKARWPFLRRVAVPMALAHEHWKKTKGPDRYSGALEILGQCQAADWRIAATQWVERRQAAFLRAQDDGVLHG